MVFVPHLSHPSRVRELKPCPYEAEVEQHLVAPLPGA